MLSDSDILYELARKRYDIPLNIVTTFTDTKNKKILKQRISESVLPPVPPSLCFFEVLEGSDSYELSSFFNITDPKYSIVPFGSKIAPTDTIDYGISYNVFINSLAIQSYTVATEGNAIPSRGSKQTNFFKEKNSQENANFWSAGHLIAHRYTPPFTKRADAATLQYGWNFIPEPAYWNCHQRNHLENNCIDRYYGVYPIYHLEHVHGRTVSPYKSNGINLPARAIPDGEFFIGRTSETREDKLYMPFISGKNSVYDSTVSDNVKKKLDVTLKNHKVNKTAIPGHISIEFERTTEEIAPELNNQIEQDKLLASYQEDLFSENYTNPLHHAAVIRYERAATKEYKSPENKIKCALIFSDLKNHDKKDLYLGAIRDHGNFLLDKCDAENPPTDIVPRQLLKEFKNKFPEEDEIIDVHQRLRKNFR